MKLLSKPCLPWLVVLAGCAAVAACGPTFHAEDGAAGAGASSTAGAGGEKGGSAGTGGTPDTGMGGTARGGAGSPSMTAGSGGRGGNASEAGRSGDGTGDTGAGAVGGADTRGGSGGTGGDDAAGGTAPEGGSGPQAGSGGISAGSAGDGGVNTNGGGAGLGGAGLGGVAGAGGATTFCAPATMIDDMEDGNDLSCVNQGRSGEWWAATGTRTGTTDPSESGEFPAFALGADARTGSVYGMRLSGQNFGHTEDDWASLGFYLAANFAYDLTSYQGLSFYAKSRASAVSIHVTFATNTTTPVDSGGTCTDDCNDHFAGTVTLDGSWRQFEVPFADLVQEGWGVQPKDLAHALFVYFGFLGTDMGPAAFDFLIDDVRLY